MKVRRIDSDGDMVFGKGSGGFLANDPDAVAQSIRTRLALWRGQWFLDKAEGTPWMQQVLGKGMAVRAVLENRILNTPGVTGIEEFEAVFDPGERRMTVTVTVNTAYGAATISETI